VSGRSDWPPQGGNGARLNADTVPQHRQGITRAEPASMTSETTASETASDGSQKSSDRMGRLLTYGVRGVLAFLLVGGIWLGIQQLIGNFHPVVAGELYRAAQLDASQIAGVQKEYGIRTIINLRGASQADWYKKEVAESQALGVNHIDFRLSATKELTQTQVEELVALMRDAPKPILVHCRGGADRSGLASALYVAAISKGSEEAAEAQLSPYYGHFPIPFTRFWAMDETFERIEPWLGFPHS
jgi:protein tyrosine/serine phosphatase